MARLDGCLGSSLVGDHLCHRSRASRKMSRVGSYKPRLNFDHSSVEGALPAEVGDWVWGDGSAAALDGCPVGTGSVFSVTAPVTVGLGDVEDCRSSGCFMLPSGFLSRHKGISSSSFPVSEGVCSFTFPLHHFLPDSEVQVPPLRLASQHRSVLEGGMAMPLRVEGAYLREVINPGHIPPRLRVRPSSCPRKAQPAAGRTPGRRWTECRPPWRSSNISEGP